MRKHPPARVSTTFWIVTRPTKFEHNRYVGDKRSQVVYDLDLADQYEYEVRVYDAERDRRLVAAVEIVSPANKDRPESRRAFVSKCVTLLRQRVSVRSGARPKKLEREYGELATTAGEGSHTGHRPVARSRGARRASHCSIRR